MPESLWQRFFRWGRPEDRLIRVIRVMGLSVCFSVVLMGWFFLVREAAVLWREGGAVLLTDGVLRLIASALFGVWAYLPYGFSTAAIRTTRSRKLFAGLAVLVFLIHASFNIQVFSFPATSTSAIAVIFLPVYLATPVLVVWGIVYLRSNLISRDQTRRS